MILRLVTFLVSLLLTSIAVFLLLNSALYLISLSNTILNIFGILLLPAILLPLAALAAVYERLTR